MRVRTLIETITETGRTHGIEVRAIPRRRVIRAFASVGGATKYAIAVVIAERFPELAPRLPPVRKPWMSEDARMAIFDAMALALVYYDRNRSRATAETPMDEASPR
jgi:hypothetical protein